MKSKSVEGSVCHVAAKQRHPIRGKKARAACGSDQNPASRNPASKCLGILCCKKLGIQACKLKKHVNTEVSTSAQTSLGQDRHRSKIVMKNLLARCSKLK